MKSSRWAEVCRLHYGKALRDYLDVPSEECRFRVFGTNGPIGWTGRPLCDHAGIIIGRKGAYGGVHFSREPFCVIDTAYYLEVDSAELDLDWAYYKLLTVDINRMDVGSAIPTTNRDEFYAQVVSYPSLIVQKKYADILYAYDELIENNRRRMVLSEDAARQLYREWFVRLRFPGHEHARITKGVPNGWAKVPLSSCARFLSGGTPKKSRADFWEGSIPWVSSGELTEMRIGRTSLNITEEAAQNGSRMVPPETILAVVRGMSLAKEFRIGLTSRHVAFNQDLKAISALPGVDGLHLFHSLDAQREQIRDQTGEASHRTKKLDTAVLSGVPVLVPPTILQRVFREHVSPLHQQWDVLERQTYQLRAARDLLLPRLMSGEIAV